MNAKTKNFNLKIIDESSPMISIKKEAIESVNETIQTIRSAQKKHKWQEHYVMLVTFNNDVKTIYDCMSQRTYRREISARMLYCIIWCHGYFTKCTSQESSRWRHCFTDGYENTSKEYSGKSIKSLVDELKGKGWVFAYIGANQEVESVATSISWISKRLAKEQQL